MSFSVAEDEPRRFEDRMSNSVHLLRYAPVNSSIEFTNRSLIHFTSPIYLQIISVHLLTQLNLCRRILFDLLNDISPIDPNALSELFTG